MADEIPFLELIHRIREGDADASVELVRLYEPAIRIAVRVRLRDAALRRLFDSMDICQSVLGEFFVRAASGQFDLDQPGQLVELLVTMARNRLTNHALKQQAACRDYRRTQASVADHEPADRSPSPSSIVAGKELLQAVHARLTVEERALAEERSAGRSWKEIAIATGATPDAVRMQLGRALDRVAAELGFQQ